MSFARRIDGEMTLQLLALSTRIVVRMMAGTRARFDVLVNLAMASTRPPGGGWLSMNDDEWEVLTSRIQTKLREARKSLLSLKGLFLVSRRKRLAPAMLFDS